MPGSRRMVLVRARRSIVRGAAQRGVVREGVVFGQGDDEEVIGEVDLLKWSSPASVDTGGLGGLRFF